jgi:Cys-tRNA(Pro)/Cys-tRNA(Cys) deacylase
VRSILFRLEKDECIMVLVAGPAQISWPSLRRYLYQSRLTLAKPEEVLAVTGYVIGTVSPFGLPTPLRTLVDESVLAQDEISVGSGKKGVGIIMHREDLMRALGEVEVYRFT